MIILSSRAVDRPACFPYCRGAISNETRLIRGLFYTWSLHAIRLSRLPC